jgi:SAM-dependent methyltransferase
MTTEMVSYYARRAAEYEKIYQLPAWQRDLDELRRFVPEFFEGRRVFEVACGTGYWTGYAALTAAEICATDVNEETLAIARSWSYGAIAVALHRADAYDPHAAGRRFDAGLAAFWLSHVDLGRMDEFLAAFHSCLEPGARVLMFDERASEARALSASRTDATGNRYEMRTLQSGERFEIVKNLYDERTLSKLFDGWADDLRYRTLENFWVLSCHVPGRKPRR